MVSAAYALAPTDSLKGKTIGLQWYPAKDHYTHEEQHDDFEGGELELLLHS